MGVADATPWPLGVDRPPPTAKSNFFKKIVWPVGVGQTTPKGHRLVMGVASTTPYHGGPWGWSGQPKGHLKNNQKKKDFILFFKNIK
jgi:hypothetical protein